ncbi:Cna B-type domain-containing protein, partial [Bacillus sp. BP-3]|uniref:Cna B-type domain-containing protein n=1 Tax=Bacillus sp. BP-3 TaxID=3022773 RepID=UPI00232FBB06
MHLKRATSIFSIIMIFMFTIGQSLLPIIANAQELSTTGFVDSFTIDKTNLKYGEQTKLNVTFSDKSGNKMKAGDTLTLTLPPELQGYNATISLNDGQGNNFGTCQVSASNVVCTFNDMVEKFHNIKGYFNFTVQATNVGTDQKKDVETNLGTTLNKQTVTIAGPTSSGTGSDPFFYKTGDIQTNNTDEVRWFLNINLNKEYLGSDILVSDSLQEGQTLNKDSFRITIENSSIGRTALSLQEFEAKGYGRIEVTSPTSFKVGIYRDKAHATLFEIYYTTAITESGKSQEFFKNDYKINYQVLYKQPVSESGSAEVNNITSGGGAQGDLPPKGTLRIVKHLEGDEEKVIPNVSFKLYKESGEQLGDGYKTDEKGIIEIKDLPPGKYYVQEVSAPKYIDFDSQKKIEFEVKADTKDGIKLSISNKVKTTSVTGTKTWNDNNASERPSTIKVDLLQNGQVVDTKDVTEATNWKYTFDNLQAYDADGKAYKYEVKEQAVDGYKSEVNGYDITNTKVGQTKVEGTKTWKDDNAKERPSKIKVDLLQNGQVVDTKDVTEATNWKYTFDNLQAYDADGKAYKYEVKEQEVVGYKSEVNGYNITNTKVGQIKVEGTKTWKDDNAAARPNTIKVDLLQNGTVIQTQDVTEATNWRYTFDNLQAYDADGKAY